VLWGGRPLVVTNPRYSPGIQAKGMLSYYSINENTSIPHEKFVAQVVSKDMLSLQFGFRFITTLTARMSKPSSFTPFFGDHKKLLAAQRPYEWQGQVNRQHPGWIGTALGH
jgi:hypothetical protein